MTDTERARQLHEMVQALNEAAREAREAGLTVTLDCENELFFCKHPYRERYVNKVSLTVSREL